MPNIERPDKLLTMIKNTGKGTKQLREKVTVPLGANIPIQPPVRTGTGIGSGATGGTGPTSNE